MPMLPCSPPTRSRPRWRTRVRISPTAAPRPRCACLGRPAWPQGWWRRRGSTDSTGGRDHSAGLGLPRRTFGCGRGAGGRVLGEFIREGQPRRGRQPGQGTTAAQQSLAVGRAAQLPHHTGEHKHTRRAHRPRAYRPGSRVPGAGVTSITKLVEKVDVAWREVKLAGV